MFYRPVPFLLLQFTIGLPFKVIKMHDKGVLLMIVLRYVTICIRYFPNSYPIDIAITLKNLLTGL